MASLSRRLLLDLILAVMLVLEMLYALTGNLLHEAVGLAFFVCVGIHLFFSRRWIAGTIRTIASDGRRLSAKRACLALIAALLLADMALLVFSSLVISNTLYAWGVGLWMLDTGTPWAAIHAASAYGLCVLTAAHLAMHWSLIAQSLKVGYDPSRRSAIGYAVGAATAVGMLAIGRIGFAKTLDLLGEGSTGDADNSTASETQEKTALSENQAEDHGQEDAYAADEARTQEEPSAETSGAEESEPAGTCPLCRNHCPLSSPGCSRPSDAGLIP